MTVHLDSMKALWFTAVVALCFAAACDPSRSEGSTGGSSSAPPKGDSPASSRGLCVALPGRAGSADVPLQVAVRAAKQHEGDAHRWVAVGHEWVKKARRTADPGFYLNADACATTALAALADDPLALNLRALVRLNDHRFRDALALAESILARDSDNPAAWGTASDALLELGDVDGAERAVQHMLDLKPDLASYGRAAYVRWLRGDTPGAITISRAAIRAGRQARDSEPLAWTLVQSATIFWNQGDVRGAGAGFDLALDTVPDYPSALIGKARVAIAENRPRDAVGSLERAIAQNRSIEAQWLLCDARRLAGDRKGAEAACAQLRKEGRRSDPRTLAQFLASKALDLPLAIELARAELRERPSVYTKDALAWALYRSGRHAEALALIEPAVALGVPDARLLFHAGAIRIATGDDETGEHLIARALSLNPHFDPVEADEARKLLGPKT